ncbi:unnamed protein product [Brachionus calyciflorus]|uniref:sulfite oxidase n=1 Tax=Brachionus calyciflorus TaxID=104777 RepID=A0A813P384_9BILA|nr:unnamed protein product [Brachionus calyciflorus]
MIRFAHSGIKNTTIFSIKNIINKNSSRYIKTTSCLLNLNDSHNFFNQNENLRQKNQTSKYLIGALGALGIGYFFSKNIAICEVDEKNDKKTSVEFGAVKEGLPFYTEDQVKQHNKTETGIWVSYKNGVYDITDFVEGHPGGNKIMWGAGHGLEPFWEKFPIHFKSEVFELLEEYRIGNLKKDETNKKPIEPKPDFYKDEPKRNPQLKVLTQKPFNAESPKEISAENLVTPLEFHFIRNHMPVPHIDTKTFKLEILNVSNGEKIEFSLDDLENKFNSVTIPVTLQCSGNKRKFMNELGQVQGLMWDVNAISTALWTGVLLKDLLIHCGIDLNDPKIKHVIFEGLDKDPAGVVYAASVPIEKVRSDNGDVLLAYKMNGQDIPLDNGYPLRIVVPGVIGARSVKWVGKIILSDVESQSFWQLNDYKVLSPSIKNLKEADFSKLKAVQESPIQSAICQPVDGNIIKRENGKFIAKGYAFSGGGNEIESVLVSIDNGQNWKNATLKKFDRPLYRSWAWTLWEAEFDIPEGKDQIEIVCTASDSNQNTQPESAKSIWNARGLLNNSWHRVKVNIQ